MSGRSSRGNSRAAKPRVNEFNSTLHQSSHGFATRAHGFPTKTKALASEIPPATQDTRIEASSIIVANCLPMYLPTVFFVPFTHTNRKFAKTSLPTLVCRVKAGPYRNTRERLEKLEKELWKHRLRLVFLQHFSFSQTCTRVSKTR